MRAVGWGMQWRTLVVLTLVGLAATVTPLDDAAAKNYRVEDQAGYREAVGRLKPGDRLMLADGVWRDFQIVFQAEGTEDQPITLMAETPGKVILSGQSNLRIAGRHLVVWGLTFKDGHSPTGEVISLRRDSRTLAHHVRLVENVIDGFNKPDREQRDYWLGIYGRNNRVDHNYFAGKTNQGPTVVVRLNTPESQQNGHLIDHNYFGHRPPLGGNGGETIRIGTSHYSRTRSGTVIRRNYFERCDGEVEIISNKSEGNTITENVFFESRGAVVLRHGGRNVVSRNVFFGNGVADTGGIRVINEHQQVVDNYLEGLRGRKFLGALTVMNGVPNSPANRYHQVRDARIAGNSFVDVTHIGFGVGSDAERSAPPADSVFQANLIAGNAAPLVGVFDDTSGIAFADNVSDNQTLRPFGARIDAGLALERAANGLLYPVGAQVGAPGDLQPVARAATGPRWYNKPPLDDQAGRLREIGPDGAALRGAVADAQPGDVLRLAAATYDLTAPLQVAHALRIVGVAGAQDRPRTTLRSAGGPVIQLLAGADLTVETVRFEQAGDGAAVLRAEGASYAGAYTLTLRGVEAAGIGQGPHAPFLAASPATFAASVLFDRLAASDWRGAFVALSGAGLDGWYLADTVAFRGSIFRDMAGPLVVFGREGRDESTFGPRFALTDSVLQRVGAGAAAVDLDGIDGLALTGNQIADSGRVAIRQRVVGLAFDIADNDWRNTPDPTIVGVDGAALVSGRPQ